MIGRLLAAGALVLVPVLTHAQATRPARLSGTVYDSTLNVPLALASVDVILANDPSRLWRATTDARGDFRIDSLDPGGVVVAITHPRLDSLGVQQLSLGVTLRAGESERVRLAVPAATSLVRRVCGDSVAAEQSGYVRGIVRHAERAAGAVPGTVDVRWTELEVTGEGTERSTVALQARADAEGRFTLCGVPVDGTLQLRAWYEGDSTGVTEFTVPPNGILLRDLVVGRARAVTLAVRDSTTGADTPRDATTDTTVYEARVKRGDAQITGAVRGPNSAPVANAVVSVWGTGLEQRTGADGRFALGGLPTGSWTAEVRAVGYRPQRAVLDIWPGDSTRLDVALDDVKQLETVRIFAKRAPVQLSLERFENNRRTRGNGRFITPAMLDARPPLRTMDVFRTIPGVRVVPGPLGDQVVMRAPSLSEWCAPELWVDGVRVTGDLSLDFLVNAPDLLAVEVYASGPRAPAELTGLSGCGAIVMYTGDRKAAKR